MMSGNFTISDAVAGQEVDTAPSTAAEQVGPVSRKLEDFQWNLVGGGFSQVPEQAFRAVARMSRLVELKLDKDGDLEIKGQKSMCSHWRFCRIAGQMEELQYPAQGSRTVFAIDKRNRDIKHNIFLPCSYKGKDAQGNEVPFTESGFCKGCSKGAPCRLLAAGYYKWLSEYAPEQMEEQRVAYRQHKDEVDANILFNRDLLSPVLKPGERYPHIATATLDRIREDIDRWKYCIYERSDSDLEVVKHYEGTEYVEFEGIFPKKALSDWAKAPDCELRVSHENHDEYNGNLFPYLFVVDLLRRGEYAKYYEAEKAYERSVKKPFHGNSYFGCVIGSDRAEVFSAASELCEKIRLSFGIEKPDYLKLTAMDAAQRLCIAQNPYPEYRPVQYGHLLDNTVYLITGLKEFTQIANEGLAPHSVSNRQCRHLLKELSPFSKDRYIVLAGEQDEVDEFLKLMPSFEALFRRNAIVIEDLTAEQVGALYRKELRSHNIPFGKQQQKEFHAYLVDNMGAFAMKNSTLAYFLAEISIKAGRFTLPTDIAGVKRANFMEELDKLIGMENIKQAVRDFYGYTKYAKAAAAQGAKIKAGNMHMLFTGNPGTGKTTIARILARALYDIGVVKENKLIEATREDLVGKYLGQTAPKTKEVIEKARNGVLFIDEAYSLTNFGASGSADQYGAESIATLIKAMEDYSDSLVVIFAGYKKEMRGFVDSNPGIKSRIGYTFHFEDYSEEELKAMYFSLLARTGFAICEAEQEAIEKNLSDLVRYFRGVDNLGNGRFVEKLYHLTLQRRAKRDSDNLLQITADDIPDIRQVIDSTDDNSLMQTPDKIQTEEKRRVAYHELGHAIVAMDMDKDTTIKRITVEMSANGAMGYVEFDGQHRPLKTADRYRDEICRLMAGIAAEELFLGAYSNSGGSDLPKATNIAKHMVLSCGMGQAGFAVRSDAKESEYIEEVNALLAHGFEKAKCILTQHRTVVEQLVDELIARGTIEKADITAFFQSAEA